MKDKIKDKIKVSVICLAYNHESYIRKALEGFVMQKTNFDFEVVIHDDASTDGTADIIREFEAKYPNIIKPIYQTENQYSKGVLMEKTFMYPKAKGKYFAYCEGDDYWCSEVKLQNQFDFMKKNPDYSLITNKHYRVNALGETIDSPKVNKSSIIELKLEDVFYSHTMFSTASLFIRADIVLNCPEFKNESGTGDFVLKILAGMNGKIAMIEEIYSVYRVCSIGSWSDRMAKDRHKLSSHYDKTITFFNEMRTYYGEDKQHHFDDIITHRKIEKYCVDEDYKSIFKNKTLTRYLRKHYKLYIIIVIKFLKSLMSKRG